MLPMALIHLVVFSTIALAQDAEMLRHFESPHSLNADARRDRIAFLTEQLTLKRMSPEILRAIPDLVQPEPKQVIRTPAVPQALSDAAP